MSTILKPGNLPPPAIDPYEARPTRAADMAKTLAAITPKPEVPAPAPLKLTPEELAELQWQSLRHTLGFRPDMPKLPNGEYYGYSLSRGTGSPR